MSDDEDATDGCPMHGGGYGGNGDDQLSYGSYLKVPELLSLQQTETDPAAHDELLFITIHQAYELWFKQIIYELLSIRQLLDKGDIYESTRLFDRVLTIEELLVDQIHILETMRPRDFLAFRSALQPASGFQSIQFREVEFLSGIGRPGILEHVHLTDDERQRLEQRIDEPSLREGLYQLLADKGYDVAVPERLEPFEGEDRERTIAALAEIYGNPRDHQDVYSLIEKFVDHDQNLLLWRFHHVRVVERLISTKQGTGGSPGVEYLESTLDKRAFPLLWEARGELDDETYFGLDPLGDDLNPEHPT